MLQSLKLNLIKYLFLCSIIKMNNICFPISVTSYRIYSYLFKEITKNWSLKSVIE